MSLGRALRSLTDDELATLLVARPDLAHPPPRTFDDLADRAARWPGVADAYHSLDRFCQQLVEALCLLPDPATVEAVVPLAAGTTDRHDVEAGLTRLAALALAWREGAAVHLNPGVRRAVSRPGGLGAPVSVRLAPQPASLLAEIAANVGLARRVRKKHELLAELALALSDPATVERLVAEAPDPARALFHDLVHRGVVGQLPGYGLHWTGGTPRTPIAWLESRGLLASIDWTTLEPPREVVVALRGGRPLPPFDPRRPPLATTPVEPARAEGAAADAAARLVTAVAALLCELDREPASLLKAGGVGVRDLRRVAKQADVEEREAARLVQLAAEAVLIGGDDRGDVVPTDAADEWLAAPPAEQWLRLVEVWLDVPADISLAGDRDGNDKPVPPLTVAVDRVAPDRRAQVLAALASLPEGEAAEPASLAAHVWWSAPSRWGRVAQNLVTWTLEEAALLGVTGLGALSPAVRLLLAGRRAEAAEASVAMLPPVGDTFVLQADLTAVAVGRLARGVAERLSGMADVESRGPATSWRFGESSLRRAFDEGETAPAVRAFLERHSTTGVPQPLAYLVDDVARRHGGLRVGAVSCYLRSDDASLVAEVLRSKRTARLALRALAPTVLVSTAAPDLVLRALRSAGFLPVREGDDGGIVLERPERRRAPARGPREVRGVDRDAASAVVAALRSAAAKKGAPREAPAERLAERLAKRLATTPAAAPQHAPALPFPATGFASGRAALLALLERAMDDEVPLEIAYTNAKGVQRRRVVEPLEVDGPSLYAWCHLSRAERVFALGRIAWARPASEGELVAAGARP